MLRNTVCDYASLTQKKKKKTKSSPLIVEIFPLLPSFVIIFSSVPCAYHQLKRKKETKKRIDLIEVTEIAHSKSAIPMNKALRTRYYFDPLTVLYGSFFLFFLFSS